MFTPSYEVTTYFLFFSSFMYFDEETYLSLNAGFAMVVNLQGKNLN